MLNTSYCIRNGSHQLLKHHITVKTVHTFLLSMNNDAGSPQVTQGSPQVMQGNPQVMQGAHE